VPRFRIAILWLTAVFVVAGASFGFAKVGHVQTKETPSVESTSSPDGDEADEATENTSDNQSGDNGSGSENRPQNHGFYVSQAAQCNDVDDPDTAESPDFAAPDDCTGHAHGEFVSSVAQSDLGKTEHSHGHGSSDEGSEGS